MGLFESENVLFVKNCEKPQTGSWTSWIGSSLPGTAQEKVKIIKNLRKILEVENRVLILKSLAWRWAKRAKNANGLDRAQVGPKPNIYMHLSDPFSLTKHNTQQKREEGEEKR